MDKALGGLRFLLRIEMGTSDSTNEKRKRAKAVMRSEPWFYELLMQEFGPTQAAEVRQLVEDRTLGPNDRVRPASSSTWISVTEFMSMAPWSDVAEIADVAEIDERHLQLDIDSFNLEGNSAGRPNADLDIDAFNLQGNGDSPLPVAVNSHRPVSAPEAEPDEDDEPAPNYFVRSLGHELGPLTQEALIEMAHAGAFSLGYEIREGDHGKWVAI